MQQYPTANLVVELVLNYFPKIFATTLKYTVGEKIVLTSQYEKELKYTENRIIQEDPNFNDHADHFPFTCSPAPCLSVTVAQTSDTVSPHAKLFQYL